METKKDEKVNQTFVPDIMNKRDITSYFKDLIDIGPMLVMDWMEELARFRKKLEKIGWGKGQINEMLQIACTQSRHLKSLPSIRDRGNWLEWLNSKGRIK